MEVKVIKNNDGRKEQPAKVEYEVMERREAK